MVSRRLMDEHASCIDCLFKSLQMTVTSTSCFLAGLLGKRELGAQGILFQFQAIAAVVIIVSCYYPYEKA